MPKIVLSAEPLLDGTTALRPWRDSDIPAIVDACQDPDIVRWTRVPEQYGEVNARMYLMQRYDSTHAGATAPYAIVDADDDERLFGSISLMRIAWEHARAEVGYWLAPDARGQGHATRALWLISAWGFETLGLERIDLLAATGNPGSQRVAERGGYTREAVLRSYMTGKDGQLDMIAYGRLASDAGAPGSL